MDETVEFKSYLVAVIGIASSIVITRLPALYYGPNYLGLLEMFFQFFAFFVPIGIVSFSLASLLAKASSKELTAADRRRYLFYTLTNSLPIISVWIKRLLM
ncbi:MAG TPA: hypothetical protein VGH50_05760 [Candidatus Binatia bacterium]